MKYVCFEQSLEVQVGGHFYHFAAGNYHIEDELADIIVANYHDRGAGFGTLPSEGGPEPLPLTIEDAVEAPASEPETDAPVEDPPATSSTRRSRAREA